MKKLIVLSLLVLGGLFVLKKTNVGSYACTLWNNGRAAIQKQVPRQFELDRVRQEIQKLDTDVRNMLDPIAAKQYAVAQLEQQIKNARVDLNTRRTALLQLTSKVEAGQQQISHQNDSLSHAEAKARLALDFARFKADDAHLKSREKLLAAQKKTLQLAHEQLTRIMQQKTEFEVRLAQLEAAEEDLNLKAITTPLRLDQTRVAEIKSTLDGVQKSQEIEAIKRSLEERYSGRPASQPTAAAPTVDLNEVRTFLGVPCCPEAPAVAENK